MVPAAFESETFSPEVACRRAACGRLAPMPGTGVGLQEDEAVWRRKWGKSVLLEVPGNRGEPEGTVSTEL